MIPPIWLVQLQIDGVRFSALSTKNLFSQIVITFSVFGEVLLQTSLAEQLATRFILRAFP